MAKRYRIWRIPEIGDLWLKQRKRKMEKLIGRMLSQTEFMRLLAKFGKFVEVDEARLKQYAEMKDEWDKI